MQSLEWYYIKNPYCILFIRLIVNDLCLEIQLNQPYVDNTILKNLQRLKYKK